MANDYRQFLDPIVYTISIIFVCIWALVSLLPLVGVLTDWGTLRIVGHLAFAAAGFPGAFAVLLFYKTISDQPSILADIKRRTFWVSFLALYGIIWTLAYMLFVGWFG